MYWVTMRQHRAQVLTTFVLLAVFGAVLLVHGLGTAGAADGLSGVALDAALRDRHEVIFALIGWLPLVPLLIGVFWGAPVLAGEFERGTYRLAWSQSVSRRRWVASKLALLALVVTLAGLVFGLMVNAWVGTFEGTQYAMRFSRSGVFMASGIAAAGWWLFAFMLGVAGGALLRRQLPAMLLTIAVFFVALFGFVELRDDYATPERFVAPTAEPMAVPEGDAMIVGSAMLDSAGREVSGDPACGSPECLDGHRTVTYLHPADRYWRFQWTEAGLLAAGALLLGAVGYYRVVR